MQKILLVDDDEDLLLVLRHALKGQGYSVTTLADPSLVIQAIERLSPDIIILDINMGEWDGRTICAALKNSQSYKQIPVVLYSGMVQEKEALMIANADLFLQKPLSTNYFLKKILEFKSL